MFARLDRVEHAIQPPAHLRDPLRIAAAMCAVEIAQQRHCERRVLKHHGHDARCIVVGRARPRSHASAAVLGHDRRQRFEGAANGGFWAKNCSVMSAVMAIMSNGPRANARSPLAGKIMSVMTDALQCSLTILRPEEITFAMIEDRELFPRPLRSVLIERFGTERFIEEAKQRGLVRVVHVGREGRLWKGEQLVACRLRRGRGRKCNGRARRQVPRSVQQRRAACWGPRGQRSVAGAARRLFNVLMLAPTPPAQGELMQSPLSAAGARMPVSRARY